MFKNIDFWDHYAAKRGIKFVTEAEELDQMSAELLAGCSLGEDSALIPSDPPNFDLTETDTYSEQEEVNRLLVEREEHALQRQIDAWEEQNQLAWYDELLTELRLHKPAVSGGFPQERSQLQPQAGPAANSYQAFTRKSSNSSTAGQSPIGSGGFPQKTSDKSASTRLCTPGLAGVLSLLHLGHESTLVVLEELQSKEPYTGTKIKEEISRRISTLEFLRSLARSAASGVALHDWERRLPASTKRAFAFLALARHPDAKSFTFRLGHEAVEAAMRAKHGPTDYLARILQRQGLTQTVFVLERSASESNENNPWHIHGIAIIPDDLLNSLTREAMDKNGSPKPSKLRTLLAPPPNPKAMPPIRGYRQRWNNKAIDIAPARTPGGWFQYITKEVDFTSHDLAARPDYASRSAIQAGKAQYESIREWISPKPARRKKKP